MAEHYSEYSAVLEVEKAMLGMELGRIGELLMKANKDRRNLQGKFSTLQKNSSQEIFGLKREVEEKVGIIRLEDWKGWKLK